MKAKSLSRVRLLATPWTVAYQAPPPMGFSRQEYWSGVPLTSPRISLKPNIFVALILTPQCVFYIISETRKNFSAVFLSIKYIKCSFVISALKPTDRPVKEQGFLY